MFEIPKIYDINKKRNGISRFNKFDILINKIDSPKRRSTPLNNPFVNRLYLRSSNDTSNLPGLNMNRIMNVPLTPQSEMPEHEKLAVFVDYRVDNPKPSVNFDLLRSSTNKRKLVLKSIFEKDNENKLQNINNDLNGSDENLSPRSIKSAKMVIPLLKITQVNETNDNNDKKNKLNAIPQLRLINSFKIKRENTLEHDENTYKRPIFKLKKKLEIIPDEKDDKQIIPSVSKKKNEKVKKLNTTNLFEYKSHTALGKYIKTRINSSSKISVYQASSIKRRPKLKNKLCFLWKGNFENENYMARKNKTIFKGEKYSRTPSVTPNKIKLPPLNKKNKLKVTSQKNSPRGRLVFCQKPKQNHRKL